MLSNGASHYTYKERRTREYERKDLSNKWIKTPYILLKKANVHSLFFSNCARSEWREVYPHLCTSHSSRNAITLGYNVYIHPDRTCTQPGTLIMCQKYVYGSGQMINGLVKICVLLLCVCMVGFVSTSCEYICSVISIFTNLFYCLS